MTVNFFAPNIIMVGVTGGGEVFLLRLAVVVVTIFREAIEKMKFLETYW